MKEVLILMGLLLVGAIPAHAQASNRYKVTGPVKAYRLETARLTDVGGKSVEGPRVLIERVTYDENRNPTEQIMNGPDGTLRWKYGWKSTYDAQGRQVQREFYNANGVVTSRVSFGYYEGTRIEATYYNPDGLVNHFETDIFDSNGHKLQERHRNPDGTVRRTVVFTYDDKGYQTEENYYLPNGSLKQRSTFKYDEWGNRTEWTAYSENGVVNLKYAFTYSADSRGNPIEFLKYSNDNILLSKETYTYEFDDHGNWIKSKTVREMITQGNSRTESEIGYRTITYY